MRSRVITDIQERGGREASPILDTLCRYTRAHTYTARVSISNSSVSTTVPPF